MKFASGINVTADVELGYEEMKRCFEMSSGENFHKTFIDNKKEKIRLHHYIQSFDPKENITPEQAHKIGLEWAKKAFGNDRQIICSTHIDKGHIHNHFAVSAYDFNKKLWHSNKASLQKVRDISDEICKKYGLSTIENDNAKKRKTEYKEWLEINKNTSWKEDLRNKIDSLILREDVNSLDDLCSKLKAENYTVRKGKYISIKPPNLEKSIRTFRLGDGYTLEDLAYRIEHKDKETSLEFIQKTYVGISFEYAISLRQMQISMYNEGKNSRKISYKTLIENAEILNYLYTNNISTKEKLQEDLSKSEQELSKLNSEKYKLKDKLDDYAKLYRDGRTYFSMDSRFSELSEDEKKQFFKLEYIFRRDIKSESDVENLMEELNEIEKSYEELCEKSREFYRENQKLSRIYDNVNKMITEETKQKIRELQENQNETNLCAIIFPEQKMYHQKNYV